MTLHPGTRLCTLEIEVSYNPRKIAQWEGIDVSEENPNDVSTAEEAAAPEHDSEGLPSGAVAITAMLAVIILIFWFGIYVMDLVRS